MFVRKYGNIFKVFIFGVMFYILSRILCIIRMFWIWSVDKLRGLFQFIIKHILTKECWEEFIEVCSITHNRVINMVVFYMVLCLLFTIMSLLFRIIVLLVVACFKRCINGMDILILGKRNQKSLAYRGITLWYVKFKADIEYFLYWISIEIIGNVDHYSTNNTKIHWIRMFSLENMVIVIKKFVTYFLNVSFLRLSLGAVSIYTYYENDILSMVKRLYSQMLDKNITLNQLLDIFETGVIIFLLCYIAFDMRHKANGYSELRSERFKELIQMEEKLLNIIGGILYSLEHNIDVISRYKCCILVEGASLLSGKQCYIEGGRIVYNENKYIGFQGNNDIYQLSELDDMKEEFQKLAGLEKEFKESALCWTNINLIDHSTMLTRVSQLWIPGIDDNKEYMKMQFFCKSSMKKWYTNRFVKAINSYNGERQNYSESQTTEIIFKVSQMLDYELVRAFGLELYLKRYRRRMTKRFERINNFARFNLN